ncbi:MAG: flavodoxin family protein [Chlorobium sp.]|uniref:flavodoxin family protein n=1 Tax=Chlorobium sp. TaxID=1095 RepID=UPI0034456A88|nr:flavodoxin family protein [Chlorobium sp.]
MKRCLLIYLSLRGTTEKTAGAIAAGLRSAGYLVDLCNMAHESPSRPEGYDLLGIGSPAHYFRLPFNISDYLHVLRPLDGLPFFSFMLYGSYPGEAGNLLRKALSGKGGREVGYFHCRGADYYQGYLQEGYLFRLIIRCPRSWRPQSGSEAKRRRCFRVRRPTRLPLSILPWS